MVGDLFLGSKNGVLGVVIRILNLADLKPAS